MNKDVKELIGSDLRKEVENLRRISLFDSEKYESCEKLAQPYIEEMNRRAENIAKQFNKRPLRMTFRSFRGKTV